MSSVSFNAAMKTNDGGAWVTVSAQSNFGIASGIVKLLTIGKDGIPLAANGKAFALIFENANKVIAMGKNTLYGVTYRTELHIEKASDGTARVGWEVHDESDNSLVKTSGTDKDGNLVMFFAQVAQGFALTPDAL